MDDDTKTPTTNQVLKQARQLDEREMYRLARVWRKFMFLRALQENSEDPHVIVPDEALAMLVLADAINDFARDFVENIHRAGEGI